MHHILLIEDSDPIRNSVKGYLELNDFTVTALNSCHKVEEVLQENPPNLAILDITLPDGNGFFLARDHFKPAHIPFLFLSSHNEESDRITGLELGALDYIVKPFSMKELVLRIDHILSRLKSTNSKDIKNLSTWVLDSQKLSIDRRSHKCFLNNNRIKLTTMEWEILIELMRHSGAILSREQIQKSFWHITEDQHPRTVDSHIKNIRQKLNSPNWIVAVRGFGFSFKGKEVK